MLTTIPAAPCSWSDVFSQEQEKSYFQAIIQSLSNLRKTGRRIYPADSQLYNAFLHTPYHAVKVVILGQDPYHGQRQAHGLSFSVPNGIAAPPSLRNIQKALLHDIGNAYTPSNDLTHWAKQGVFLLNTILSVEDGHAGSHHALGWQTLTSCVIRKIADKKDPVVFLLWGKHAKAYATWIHQENHLTLTAPHPSPLSAHRGFLQCNHFSKTNAWLHQHGSTGIHW